VTKIVSGNSRGRLRPCGARGSNRKGLLYATAQHGVYVSYDDGDSWQSLSLNLPDVPVSDLIVESNDLVISTHGRGFYVLDNVAPLRQYAAEMLSAQKPVLFTPATGIRGTNGVGLAYWLPKAAQRVRVDILDSAGAVVRSWMPDTTRRDSTRRDSSRAEPTEETFRAPPPTPAPKVVGMNGLTWDLRYTGATTFPGMILWADRRRDRPLPRAATRCVSTSTARSSASRSWSGAIRNTRT